MFCCMLLYVHSSIAIILMGKRELIALLNLSSWCLVMVERLFLAVPRGCLQFVIVVFPDHTHLLFLYTYRCSCTSKCRWDLPTLKKRYNFDKYLSLQHWMLFKFLSNESVRIYSLEETGTEVTKLFSCSTQLSTKFQLNIPTNIVFCFKSLRCCIYHANKC